MSTLEALLQICLMLNTAGSPYEGWDVIINAHGVYDYLPSWEYQKALDSLCSLKRMEEIADMQPNTKTVVGK